MTESVKTALQNLHKRGWELRLRAELEARRAWLRFARDEDGVGADEVIKIAVAVVILLALLVFGKTIYNSIVDQVNRAFSTSIPHL